MSSIDGHPRIVEAVRSASAGAGAAAGTVECPYCRGQMYFFKGSDDWIRAQCDGDCPAARPVFG